MVTDQEETRDLLTGSRKWIPLSGILESRPNLRMILANTGWLLFDRIFRMSVGLVVGVWIARYLGPHQFGLLNYALSFAAIVGSISTLGLDSIVVREIVKTPEKKDALLGTSLVLRVGSGIVVLLLCSLAALFEHTGSDIARAMIAIVAFGYVFQAFDTVDCWFQANVQSRFSVVAKSAAFFLISIVKVICLLAGASLFVFAVLAMAEILLGAVGLLVAYRFHGQSLSSWRFDGGIVRSLLKDSWPLTLSGLSIAIYMKIDQVLLGNLLGAHAVGIYSAGVKLVELWYFVPMAFTTSVLPSIVEARNASVDLYNKRMQQLYDLMSLLGLGLAVLMTIFSKPIVILLYGQGYAEASPILTLYIWSGVATFLGVASSQYLLAENLTRISLYRTLIGMFLNVVLNFILIPLYGTIGSALAALVSYFAATFSVFFFDNTRLQAYMMVKSLFLPRIIFSKWVKANV